MTKHKIHLYIRYPLLQTQRRSQYKTLALTITTRGKQFIRVRVLIEQRTANDKIFLSYRDAPEILIALARSRQSRISRQTLGDATLSSAKLVIKQDKRNH